MFSLLLIYLTLRPNLSIQPPPPPHTHNHYQIPQIVNLLCSLSDTYPHFIILRIPYSAYVHICILAINSPSPVKGRLNIELKTFILYCNVKRRIIFVWVEPYDAL